MTLQDITTPKVLNFVNLLIADGWFLKRISFKSNRYHAVIRLTKRQDLPF